MKFPGRRELEAVPEYAGVYGGRVDGANPREGIEDDGNLAWPERREQARRLWTEADAADFEPLDRNGRRWRDLGSGTEYKALSGAPLLASGEATRGVGCFFVLGANPGRLVVLRRSDYAETLLGPVSYVHGQQLSAATPGPDLRIR